MKTVAFISRSHGHGPDGDCNWLCPGQQAEGEGRQGCQGIVDTAVDAGDFKTLAAALKAADLIETLKGKGPFTVFTPTDEAFEKLSKGTVEDLLKPETEETRQYPNIPRVAEQVMAADVVKLK